MVGVLRPFRSMFSPGPYQAQRGVLSIDWTHPLTNGLIAAFVPSGSGTIFDIARSADSGQGGDLQRSGSTVTDGMSPDGPGLMQLTNGQGAVSIGLPATSQLRTSTAISFFMRCLPKANAVNGTGLFTVTYDNLNTSPFLVWGLIPGSGGTIAATSGGVRFMANNGVTLVGTPFTPTDGPLIVNTMESIGGSVIVGGNFTKYRNGLIVNGDTTAFGATPPISTNSSCVTIGDEVNNTRATQMVTTAAYIWNRVLTAAEQYWIFKEPFAFIIPFENEMPVIRSAALASILFRKTSSRIGTRTGTRQTWAG